jgi:putative tricarboxylic transport membrane protein
MQQETPGAPEQSAVSKRTLEIVTAIFFLVIGSVVMWDSLRTGAGWGNDGPQSGYFPFYTGLLMSVASAANLFLAVRSSKAESFVSLPQIKLVLAIFLPCLVYVTVMQWLGLYAASLIFIAVFMRWQGKFSLLSSGVTALVVVLVLFVMFEIWFKVPLIKGPIEAALGY